MNSLPSAALSLSLLATSAAAQEATEVSPNGTRASFAGAAENFSGVVTVTPLFSPDAFSNASGAVVEFTPGARTAWHMHPAWQTIIITSGVGWVQQQGGEKLEVKAGDVVRFPPRTRHWHGATNKTSMAHIAITPMIDEAAVEWLEPVSDEDYHR